VPVNNEKSTIDQWHQPLVDNDRLHAAALRIQSCLRGYLQRNKYHRKESIQAAIIIQKTYR
ncbi:unnamed protein product, partial [Didymodactylos carnosus]